MITPEEISLARESLQCALSLGAQAARVTLTKTTENIVATLDGAVDKVTRCADRSISIALFVDGRFGSFSINKLDSAALQGFVREAVDTVRMFEPDTFRKLPSADRYCTSARTGRELSAYDDACPAMSPSERVERALAAAVTGKDTGGVRVISEEGEYSDTDYDTLVLDSQGLECRHSETTFDYGVEVTIEDARGLKYSDFWWTSSPLLKDFDASACGLTAVKRAAAQIGARPARSGKYNMVVSTEAASKMVSPLLNALNAYSIQQGNSFLVGSLGKKVFHDGLTIIDEPLRPGETGSKLFDGEGIACVNEPVIEDGIVRRYSVNTYMAGKLGIAPTVEDVIRARVAPWPYPGLDRDRLMSICGDGILVTDFNGGNCNMTTGDFSYGISGQLFRGGVPVRPVNEMLVTGNFLDLWSRFIAAGDDYRVCSSRLVPSLAFSGVDFSG